MNTFVGYQRLLLNLNNDRLRTRHWSLLLSKANIDSDLEFSNFKVKTFISLDQTLFDQIIMEVVDIANEESDIEEQLSVIRKRWDERKFELTRERIGDTSSHKLTVINKISLLHEEVEKDDLIIDMILNKSKSLYFRPDLEKMKAILAKITGILRIWISTQENCLVLARYC